VQKQYSGQFEGADFAEFFVRLSSIRQLLPA